MTQTGTRVRLHAPAFSLELDTADGLRAIEWENRITGDVLELGGHPEFEIDLDRATRRIPITGWRGIELAGTDGLALDDEPGYRAGYFDPAFDDRDWTGMLNASQSWYFDDQRYCWVRTHLFLPTDAEAAAQLTLVFGGQGLFDYRQVRAFVNGQELGLRRTSGRWSEPQPFDLGPNAGIRPALRFGQDNVIALQLRGYVTRTPRLDELDPAHARQYPLRCTWPAQFEQLLVVGRPQETVRFQVSEVRSLTEGEAGATLIELVERTTRITAEVRYEWSAGDGFLRRSISLRNRDNANLRVLDVRSGTYETGRPVSDGEMGSPVFIDDSFAVGLAHPAGWAMGEGGVARLRQYPGCLLPAKGEWQAMEAVLGVSERGAIKDAFRRHVLARSRRVRRRHDRPIAILEPFGSWEYDRSTASGRYVEIVSDAETEEAVLDVLGAVGEAGHDTGIQFDLCSIDFWVDHTGDLVRFAPDRFPTGLDRILPVLDRLGMEPGLWIDSSWEEWSVGGNPVVSANYTHDPAYGTERPTLCRATDPIRTMYSRAFAHHIREAGIRLLKFDNFQSVCYNPGHPHLPGLYSTEAIHNGVLESLRAYDAANPDVFLMCYWGYRSPWWLLDADTMFEPGIFVEAAHPAGEPTLYVRDSVTVGLDQAHWFCEDVPWLGKDSLGVWLSDWKWNSSIGRERWVEAFIMDISRGSLLAQPWSDRTFLDLEGRHQLADLIALLRANPDSFRNSRFVLGNPWRSEPYGYLCEDGERAFVALNNPTWRDAEVNLDFDRAFGLADRLRDLYRWYPRPAQIDMPVGKHARLWLRPFEVVLLEAVPAGTRPSLGREFPIHESPAPFTDVSRSIDPSVAPLPSAAAAEVPYERRIPPAPTAVPPKRAVRVSLVVPPTRRAAVVVVTAALHRDGTAHVVDNTGQFFAARASASNGPVEAVPVVREWTLPVPWQAWRIGLDSSNVERSLDVDVTIALDAGVEIAWAAHLIPS